jgi:DNA-directed RNA polymerase subunit RPC12/RpoP
MKKKKIKMEYLCGKCGKTQLPVEEKSTKNWEYFDCQEKCECGGSYKINLK